MKTYHKWCAFGLAMLFAFAMIMCASDFFSSEVKMIVRLANMAWFFPLSMWSFDRQLKAEAAAGLPQLSI